MYSFKEEDNRMKEVVKKSQNPKKISKVQFGTLTSTDIQKVAELRVSNRSIFSMPDATNPTRHPTVNGCMDARMGISNKADKCETCRKNLTNCSGQFGYIQLELPVFHAGYFKHTLTILQCICKRYGGFINHFLLSCVLPLSSLLSLTL